MAEQNKTPDIPPHPLPGATEDSDEKKTPPVKKRSGFKLLFLLVGIVVVAFMLVVAGSEYFAKRSGGGSGTTTQSGGVQVGGPFTLVNQDGKQVTEKDFLGGYMLVFFGYTYCPDVCPTVLSDIATVLDMLGEEKAAKITPVFISVDPARDTPDHLAEYVKFFHPRTVGLTGTEEQIKAVAREYRVYYRKNEAKGDDPQDYLVDHTAIIYLMGPDGKLVTHFSHGTEPKAMAERLGKLL